MQQVAHLHCQHFLRISVCENVLQIETVWRQRACSKWPRPGRIQHQASFWRFQGPAIKSGKEAAGLSRAGLSRASWQSWQEATHGKKHEQSRFGYNVHGEATMQWTCQSWFKERRGRRLQWLEQNLCLQGCDRHRCNGDGYCRHTDSPTNPGSNEKHQEARVGGRVFFGSLQSWKACRHPNIVTVFSAHEVPKPAFLMELLGKSLNQSTLEKHIDNNGVRVAFSNAAAAVLYLHSVSIAHRDIKPSNLCHQVDCLSWEVKLIDFDAAEKLEESCWVCSTSILRF